MSCSAIGPCTWIKPGRFYGRLWVCIHTKFNWVKNCSNMIINNNSCVLFHFNKALIGSPLTSSIFFNLLLFCDAIEKLENALFAASRFWKPVSTDAIFVCVYIKCICPGLFRSVITQSGSALALWATPANDVQKTVLVAQAAFVNCSDFIGDSSKVVGCLRKVPATVLVESQDLFKVRPKFWTILSFEYSQYL